MLVKAAFFTNVCHRDELKVQILPTRVFGNTQTFIYVYKQTLAKVFCNLLRLSIPWFFHLILLLFSSSPIFVIFLVSFLILTLLLLFSFLVMWSNYYYFLKCKSFIDNQVFISTTLLMHHWASIKLFHQKWIKFSYWHFWRENVDKDFLLIFSKNISKKVSMALTFMFICIFPSWSDTFL